MPAIISAMHGAPPIDFPTIETVETFNLQARLEHIAERESFALRERDKQLDTKIHAWPRTAENDLFHPGSIEYIYPFDLAWVAHSLAAQITYFKNR